MKNEEAIYAETEAFRQAWNKGDVKLVTSFFTDNAIRVDGVGAYGATQRGKKELEAAEAKLKEMPDPEPLLTFAEAVKQRKQAGGNAEAAFRTVSILHLANVAIRTGRKIRFDPKTERAIGDEEANRLIDQPMRAPWHL